MSNAFRSTMQPVWCVKYSKYCTNVSSFTRPDRVAAQLWHVKCSKSGFLNRGKFCWQKIRIFTNCNWHLKKRKYRKYLRVNFTFEICQGVNERIKVENPSSRFCANVSSFTQPDRLAARLYSSYKCSQ